MKNKMHISCDNVMRLFFQASYEERMLIYGSNTGTYDVILKWEHACIMVTSVFKSKQWAQ